MYLAWYDASKKLTPADKIANAYIRYREKFGSAPTQVLVNPVDIPELPAFLAHVQVQARHTIAPNTFWIGRPEDNT